MGRKDKLITINSKTSEVFFDNGVLGIDGENLQGKLIFSFDEFIDGVARLEIELPNGNKSYAMMTKENETYTLPIRNFLTKNGKILLQIVITEGMEDESPIVFKGKTFYFVINSSINAEIEEDSSYDQWIDVANSKLLEIDDAIEEANNLDIEAEKVDTTTTITITKKDGTEKSVSIYDGEAGQDGRDGADAKINGVNTLTLEAGDNIELEQEGSTLTINSTGGGGGTGNYNDLSNKPKINNVELSGNKTTSDLGINIPDVSNFITKDVNNLTYYTKSSDLSNVATSGSYTDLTNKPDLSTKQDKIDSTHKLDADLVDDTTSTNKFFSGNYNDLSNKPTIPEEDNSTITKNSSNKLQTVGVKDANTTNKDKFWSGTLSQYNAIQTKDADTFYYITDDYFNNGVPSGGTTGQVLSKSSGTDFDTEWVSQHNFTHETWTFTLEDDTTVDKEIVLW